MVSGREIGVLLILLSCQTARSQDSLDFELALDRTQSGGEFSPEPLVPHPSSPQILTTLPALPSLPATPTNQVPMLFYTPPTPPPSNAMVDTFFSSQPQTAAPKAPRSRGRSRSIRIVEGAYQNRLSTESVAAEAAAEVENASWGNPVGPLPEIEMDAQGVEPLPGGTEENPRPKDSKAEAVAALGLSSPRASSETPLRKPAAEQDGIPEGYGMNGELIQLLKRRMPSPSSENAGTSPRIPAGSRKDVFSRYFGA